MIISHTHKFIFIKSFKTAGTSVEAALSNYCSGSDIVTPLNDYSHNRDENGKFIHQTMNAEEYIKLDLPNLQHVDALTIKSKVAPEVWDSYFKFSIVRNPWDRAVSFFYWVHRRNPALKPQKRFFNYLGVPFNELNQLKTSFSQYIRSEDWPNNDRFYTIDNEFCVDFVIRYERLLSDFNEVCTRLKLPDISLPRLKTGIRRQRYHYSRFFNEESKNIVSERHKNDIRLFGYEFEQE